MIAPTKKYAFLVQIRARYAYICMIRVITMVSSVSPLEPGCCALWWTHIFLGGILVQCIKVHTSFFLLHVLFLATYPPRVLPHVPQHTLYTLSSTSVVTELQLSARSPECVEETIFHHCMAVPNFSFECQMPDTHFQRHHCIHRTLLLAMAYL